MTQMMKFRIVLMIITMIFIVIAILYIDNSDLSLNRNLSNYLGIASGFCAIGALYFSNRYEKKKLS